MNISNQNVSHQLPKQFFLASTLLGGGEIMSRYALLRKTEAMVTSLIKGTRHMTNGDDIGTLIVAGKSQLSVTLEAQSPKWQ